MSVEKFKNKAKYEGNKQCKEKKSKIIIIISLNIFIKQKTRPMSYKVICRTL